MASVPADAFGVAFKKTTFPKGVGFTHAAPLSVATLRAPSRTKPAHRGPWASHKAAAPAAHTRQTFDASARAALLALGWSDCTSRLSSLQP